jgi:predicted Fe-Mo cluster-binding NifX family protein
MRIAVSSMGPGLDAEVDPRFGRCQYFIVVDPKTLDYEAIENSNIAASGGAGIASAQAVAEKEVQAVLTGNCGPNAYSTLSAAGIQVITGVTGTVREAIDQYNKGQFAAASQPSVSAHSGMGGTGKGAGSGRGAGGATRSSAGGRGGTAPKAEAATSPDRKQGVQGLKDQTEALKQQLSDLQGRIDRLGKKKGG